MAPPSAPEFFVCVIGIYVCFLTWGVLQERVSTTPYGLAGERFRYFLILNSVQSAIAATVALIYILIKRQKIGTISRDLLLEYVKVGFLNCIASPFGYMSLRHIDYPTMILGKSCKLVPVMFMNIVLFRKSFPVHKYVSVGIITMGVAGFTLLQSDKSKSSGKNSLYGLSLLTINLLIDGATNSIQDHIFRMYQVSGTQMMFFMNILGALFTLMWLIIDPSLSGELTSGMQFCERHPSVLNDIFLFSLCGALGQCFIFRTIERFGSLRLVTVTVTRKIFTMLLSVLYFGHQLQLGQWASVAFVFSGIGLEAYMAGKKKNASATFVEHTKLNGITNLAKKKD